MADKLCGICGVTITDVSSGTINGIWYCKPCCAEYTRQEMIKTGRATLYMIVRDGKGMRRADIQDFLGGLLYHVDYAKSSPHNISGKRFDCWFNGPDGHVWHAVKVMVHGDICHCKRTKEVWHPWKAEVTAAL